MILFQRLMGTVLRNSWPFSWCYIDDICDFSQSWVQYLQLTKCKIRTQSCNLLLHHVGAGAISPQETKVHAVNTFDQPTTKKDIRSFLGLAGYYTIKIARYYNIMIC